MNIYQVEEKTNGEWEDDRVNSEIISENPRLIEKWIFEKLLDDDFTGEGYKSRYSLNIYSWKNGEAQMIHRGTIFNKSETLEFIENL